MHQVEDDNEEEILPFIRKLCPGLNEEELKRATHRFKEYVDLVIRIQKRVLEEEQEQKKRKRNGE